MRIKIGTFQSRKQDRIRKSQEDRKWRTEQKMWHKNHPEFNEHKKTKEGVKTMDKLVEEKYKASVSQEELEVMEGVNAALKKIDDAHCRMFKSLHDLRVAKAELDYLFQSDAYQQMLKRRVSKASA